MRNLLVIHEPTARGSGCHADSMEHLEHSSWSATPYDLTRSRGSTTSVRVGTTPTQTMPLLDFSLILVANATRIRGGSPVETITAWIILAPVTNLPQVHFCIWVP